jgi:uncharacterized protein involved in outer membrane biogenesis
MNVSRKLRIAGIVVAGLLVLYIVLGFFAVPGIVRSQAKSFVADTYDRELALGDVRFNPFTLELEAHDCALPDADGKPLLGFARLLVNLNLSSMFGRASIERIELDTPFTHLRIAADGSLNLAQLVKPFGAAHEPEPEKPGEPLALFIGHLAVRTGRVELEDHTPSAPFTLRLTPISFDLANFSSRGSAGNAFELHARSDSNEAFDLSGNFAVSPFTAKGSFGVRDLELSTPRAYLADVLPFETTSGVLTFNGSYDLGVRPQLELAVVFEKLSLAKLALRARGAATDDIQLEQLGITDARFDLARRSVNVARVEVAGGNVLARLDAGGKLNLAALGGNANPPEPVEPPPAPDAAAEPAWSVAATEIALANLAVRLEDRQFEPGAAFSLAPVNLRVSNYRNSPEAEVDLHLDLGIDAKARLTVDGKARLAAAAFGGKVTLEDFDLTSLQPYVSRNTQMSLLKGTFGSQLDVARTADGVLSIQGSSEVANLRTVDDALRQDFVKWDLLRVTGIDYRSSPARLAVKSLFAQAPYARVIIAPDQTVNVKQVLSPAAAGQGGAEKAPAAASAALGPTDAPLPTSIGTVRIADGSANFADFWIQPNYTVSLASLSGTITGLDSKPGSRAKVALDGKVDKYAPAKIAGEMNILSQSAYSDITVSLNGVELSTVTPYSGRFAGYKIEKGKLTVDVTYHVENRQLTAGQHFVLDQLELGERVESPDAIHLPLKIAVALLKDSKGVIDIDLPLSGSLDDPQFRIGPLVWKAFVGLLTKVATSPFAWLGRLGGDEQMNIIEFPPGETVLDPAGMERLTSVAKALVDRPTLALDVPMAWQADLDGPALAKKLLDARIELAAEKQGAKKRGAELSAADDPSRRFDLLVQQFKAELPRATPLPPAAASLVESRRKDTDIEIYVAANASLEASLLANRPVSERELEELGAARGRAIQDVLLGSGALDPARVFLVRSRGSGPGGERVRAELALK